MMRIKIKPQSLIIGKEDFILAINLQSLKKRKSLAFQEKILPSTVKKRAL
jgi:hypothetical protein